MGSERRIKDSPCFKEKIRTYAKYADRQSLPGDEAVVVNKRHQLYVSICPSLSPEFLIHYLVFMLQSNSNFINSSNMLNFYFVVKEFKARKGEGREKRNSLNFHCNMQQWQSNVAYDTCLRHLTCLRAQHYLYMHVVFKPKIRTYS